MGQMFYQTTVSKKHCNGVTKKMNKSILSLILIVTLAFNTNAAVVTRNGAGYAKEENSQYVTKDEFYKWSSEFQKLLDHDLDANLVYKIASRSELHGYVSDNWNNAAKGGKE